MAVPAQVPEGIDLVGERRDAFDDGVDFAQQFPSGHENELHIRMVEDVLVVAFADGGVDGHMNGPDLHDGHVEEVPFRPVRGDGGDAVTLLNAQNEQSVGDAVDLVHIILGAVLNPEAILFPAERILLGEFLQVSFKYIK